MSVRGILTCDLRQYHSSGRTGWASDMLDRLLRGELEGAAKGACIRLTVHSFAPCLEHLTFVRPEDQIQVESPNAENLAAWLHALSLAQQEGRTA